MTAPRACDARGLRVRLRAVSAPTVVLAVTGSIAAYKAVEVARLLVKAGVEVVPIMTEAATRFLGPTTLSAICGRATAMDMWSSDHPGELHVKLAASADLVLVVPATAELLASLAQGRSTDLVRAVLLCTEAPVLLAPAMHPRMWAHPATRRNVAHIEDDGRATLLGPEQGVVASGDEGWGRMVEPSVIAQAVLSRLGAKGDLADKRVVVTAGPTVEDLDPARFLSNRSSGKMGFALAARAAARGARVTLLAGPVSLPTPAGCDRVDVRTARDMAAALDEVVDEADAVIMAAAIADYRPATTATVKLKRTDATRTIELVKNPDLLADLGARRQGRRPLLVGFALETLRDAALVEAARGKLARKGCDVVVANHAADSFDRDDNQVILVTAEEAIEVERADKAVVADRVLDWVAPRLEDA